MFLSLGLRKLMSHGNQVLMSIVGDPRLVLLYPLLGLELDPVHTPKFWVYTGVTMSQVSELNSPWKGNKWAFVLVWIEGQWRFSAESGQLSQFSKCCIPYSWAIESGPLWVGSASYSSVQVYHNRPDRIGFSADLTTLVIFIRPIHESCFFYEQVQSYKRDPLW